LISRSGVCGLNFTKYSSISGNLPLTLTLAPADREQPLNTSLKSRSGGVEDSREFAKKLGVSPSAPRERAGVRGNAIYVNR
jgi:hypothetical protein